jgi:hypothetical protein
VNSSPPYRAATSVSRTVETRAVAIRCRQSLGTVGHLLGEGGVDHRVVERHSELAGDEHDGVEALGGEGAAAEAVLQYQHCAWLALDLDRHDQQRAAVDAGQVGIAANRSSCVASSTDSNSRG